MFCRVFVFLKCKSGAGQIGVGVLAEPKPIITTTGSTSTVHRWAFWWNSSELPRVFSWCHSLYSLFRGFLIEPWSWVAVDSEISQRTWFQQKLGKTFPLVNESSLLPIDLVGEPFIVLNTNNQSWKKNKNKSESGLSFRNKKVPNFNSNITNTDF